MLKNLKIKVTAILLLAGFLSFGFFIPASSATNVTIPSNINAVPGTTVDVPINMTDAPAGLGGYAFRINYDNAILTNPQYVKTGTLSAANTVQLFSPPSDGIGDLSVGVGFGFNNTVTSGTVIIIRFSVAAGFTGTTNVEFTLEQGKTKLFDAGFTTVEANYINGSVKELPPDTDSDGLTDNLDNCPQIANPGQADADGDDVGDVCDECAGGDDNLDADSDGTPDFCDDCPNDANNDADSDGVCGNLDNCPAVSNANQADGDGDGDGNVCDNCPTTVNADQADGDGDGDGNVCDNCPTTVNADQADGDGDGDGNVCDNCPTTANADQADTDTDGKGNVCDNCPTTANADQADGDGDGDGNVCDNCPTTVNADQADGDGDGDGNVCDNCPTTANADQADGDGDGDGNACDNCPTTVNADQADGDGDGDGNVCDNCPTTVNADQADGDGDGDGNVCDNCPTTANADQADGDGDGDGNVCDNCPTTVNADQADGDADGDGNVCDNCPTNANSNQADSDSDGLGDVCDNDNDGDGLSNDCDPNPEDASDPNGANGDADSDGFTNNEECNLAGTDPTDDEDFPARPEVTQTLPTDGATAPKDASVVVRVKDDEPGIDPESGNINVMVGESAVSGSFDVKQVFADDDTEYWYIFKPYAPFGFGATVNVTLDGVTDEDGIGMEDDPYDFSFQVETAEASDSAADWADSYTSATTTPDEDGKLTITANAGSGIEGAEIVYDEDETVIPRFVPNGDIPELDMADGVGAPVAMEPPTVFEHPVTVFIPTGGADPTTLRVYYYDSASGWVAACDVTGNVLNGGQGWMVPGSRVNHGAADPDNPNTIEIQVWHFSAVQAGVDECPNDPLKTEAGDCGCGTVETDTDSDGTSDCVDGCDNDPNKIAAGACGCGTADTDADSNGTPDCNDKKDDGDDNWWEKICFISSVM